jgi:hypothetical protein
MPPEVPSAPDGRDGQPPSGDDGGSLPRDDNSLAPALERFSGYQPAGEGSLVRVAGGQQADGIASDVQPLLSGRVGMATALLALGNDRPIRIVAAGPTAPAPQFGPAEGVAFGALGFFSLTAHQRAREAEDRRRLADLRERLSFLGEEDAWAVGPRELELPEEWSRPGR